MLTVNEIENEVKGYAAELIMIDYNVKELRAMCQEKGLNVKARDRQTFIEALMEAKRQELLAEMAQEETVEEVESEETQDSTPDYTTYTFEHLCSTEIAAREMYYQALCHNDGKEADRIGEQIRMITKEKHTRPECHPNAQKVEQVATELDIPASEVAAIAAIAQGVREHKQQERATYEAEARLETVSNQYDIKQAIIDAEQDNNIYTPNVVEKLAEHGYADTTVLRNGVVRVLEARATSGELLDVGEGFYKRILVQRQEETQHMEQERQVIRVERHNDDHPTIYYHPECFTFEEAHSDNTGKQRYASVSHLEVGDEVCSMCIGSIHDAPSQETIPYPARYTINEAFNVGEHGCELVVCASGLFIMIVQDRHELGGGYGVQVIALDRLINKHLDTIEQVEQYLVENTPYRANAAVWQPLTNYNPHMDETDFLKRITK